MSSFSFKNQSSVYNRKSTNIALQDTRPNKSIMQINETPDIVFAYANIMQRTTAHGPAMLPANKMLQPDLMYD